MAAAEPNYRTFFDAAQLDVMRQRPVVVEYLERNNVELYTIEQLRTFLPTTRSKKIRDEIVPEGSPLFLQCTDNVNADYITDQLKEIEGKYAGERRHNMEILILADRNDPYKFRHGLLVIEWGECGADEFHDLPALKLICGRGDILLYTYVFLLKRQRIPMGLLELAGNFNNMAGLCAYNKFGFRENLEMKASWCFGDYGTLPMIVNPRNMSYTELDNVLRKDPSMYQNLAVDQTAEPLCDKRWLGKPQQKQLIKERERIYRNIENAINNKILKNGKDSKDKAYDLLNGVSTKKKRARGTRSKQSRHRRPRRRTNRSRTKRPRRSRLKRPKRRSKRKCE